MRQKPLVLLVLALAGLSHTGQCVLGQKGGDVEVEERAVEEDMSVFVELLKIAPCGLGPPSNAGNLTDLVAAAGRNASVCACLVQEIEGYLDRTPYYGSTVTLLGDEGVAVCSPYVYRPDGESGGLVSTASLMDESYKINEQPWLRIPVDTKTAVWSDPYFDEGGGNVEMETYSVPILDGDTVIAVATTDLPVSSASSLLSTAGFVASSVACFWLLLV
jgi:hypothetical protein